MQIYWFHFNDSNAIQHSCLTGIYCNCIYDSPYHMPCYVTVIIFFTVWLRKTGPTSVTSVEMRHLTWHWFPRERYWKYEMKQSGLDYTDLNWRPQEVIKLLICLSQQHENNRRWLNNIWDWRYEKKTEQLTTSDRMTVGKKCNVLIDPASVPQQKSSRARSEALFFFMWTATPRLRRTLCDG